MITLGIVMVRGAVIVDEAGRLPATIHYASLNIGVPFSGGNSMRLACARSRRTSSLAHGL